MAESLFHTTKGFNVRRFLVFLALTVSFSALFYTVLRLSGLAGNEMLRIVSMVLSLAIAHTLVTTSKPLVRFSGDAGDPEEPE